MKISMDALLISVVLSGLAMAQTTTTATPTFQTAVTTGMVGLGASQTAELHVINTTVPPPGAAAIACPVELDFYDSQGRTLKTSSLTNVVPATSASLTLKLSDFPTTSPVSPHTLIRGVVRTNLSSSTANPPTTLPIPIIGVITTLPIYFSPGCSVITTLEIFDTTSGVTQIFTSDTRPWQQSFLAPAFSRGN